MLRHAVFVPSTGQRMQRASLGSTHSRPRSKLKGLSTRQAATIHTLENKKYARYHANTCAHTCIVKAMQAIKAATQAHGYTHAFAENMCKQCRQARNQTWVHKKTSIKRRWTFFRCHPYAHGCPSRAEMMSRECSLSTLQLEHGGSWENCIRNGEAVALHFEVFRPHAMFIIDDKCTCMQVESVPWNLGIAIHKGPRK